MHRDSGIEDTLLRATFPRVNKVMSRRALFLACSWAAVSFDVTTVFAADPGQGETLARRWCSNCHVVASNQTQAASEAPPFPQIARLPNFDATRLAFFLLNPHPKMPDMSLTRAEAGDLAAYIATLAR